MKPSVSVTDIGLLAGTSFTASSLYSVSSGGSALVSVTFTDLATGGSFFESDWDGSTIDGASVSLPPSKASSLHLEAGQSAGTFAFTVTVTNAGGETSDPATGHVSVFAAANSGADTPTSSSYGNGDLDLTAALWVLPQGLVADNYIFGGHGSDTLVGIAGTATSGGTEILYGAGGNDLLWGQSAKTDYFVFDTTTGQDSVRNFDPTRDRLELLKMPGLASFSDLQSALSTDAQGNAVITLPAIGHGGTITLTGVAPQALTTSNVAFYNFPVGGLFTTFGTVPNNPTGQPYDALTLRRLIPATNADHLDFGSTGADVITGASTGSNIFYGGAGNDLMWVAGGGANLFLFDQTTDNAVVENFQPGRDRLEFINSPSMESWSSFQAGLNTDPAGDAVIFFGSGSHQSSVTLIGVTPASLTPDKVSFFDSGHGNPISLGGTAYADSIGSSLAQAAGLSGALQNIGSPGDDTIFGDNGTNLFYGGAGNDDFWNNNGTHNLFLFDSGTGQDFVHGFTPGHDTIGFLANAGFASAADVQKAMANDNDGDAIIALPTGGSITLLGVGTQSLGAGNFEILSGVSVTGAGVASSVAASASGGAIFGGDAGDYKLTKNFDGSLTVMVGDGNNTIIGSSGAVTCTVGNGNNLIAMHDPSASSFGASALQLGNGNDTVLAVGGNDTVLAGGGFDLVDGGLGAVSIVGGAGSSVIVGGAGASTLIGGSGPAYLVGISGHDSIVGGKGGDTISAAAGDTVEAGAGNDFVILAAGPESVAATLGAGNVVIGVGGFTGPGQQKTITLGSGIDVLLLNASVAAASAATDGILVTGYQSGIDHILLQGLAEHGFGQLQIGTSGGNAIVTLADVGTVTLVGMTGKLTAADFIFS